MAKIYATGKRKTAIAKVWLTPGSGKLSINETNLNDWLGGHEAIKMKVMQPLLLTKQEKSVDIIAVTCGSEEAAYTAEGRHHRKVEEYLACMLRAFEMCKADYAGTFVLYGINDK